MLASSILLMPLSCGKIEKLPTKPAESSIVRELGSETLRVLVVAPASAGSLSLLPGDQSARVTYISAIVGRVAASLGLKVIISSGSLDTAAPEKAFVSSDLVAGFLSDSPALRRTARLLPFFPLPGKLPEGPAVGWWAIPVDRPLLASALAQALYDLRVDGSFSADIDAAAGAGSAERYLTAIGYDGILRAQYLELDAAQLEWLRSRRASGGGLEVAVREGGQYAYVPRPDGSVEGLDFDLVVALSRSIGLEPRVSVQKEIAQFFKKDGVLPPDLGKADYDYTPDLLQKVDVYANPWGVTPWRQRMMSMVTIYPIRNQLAGRKGEEVQAIEQLDGKRFAVVKDSVQEKTLEAFASSRKLKISFVYSEGEDRLFALVREGKADYILDGSVVFALNIEKIKDFSLSPFFSELQGVAWAAKKDDAVFSSILETFFEASRKSGLLSSLWTKTFRMDFKSYLDAMSAAETSAQ